MKDHSIQCVTCALSWFHEYIRSKIHGMNIKKNTMIYSTLYRSTGTGRFVFHYCFFSQILRSKLETLSFENAVESDRLLCLLHSLAGSQARNTVLPSRLPLHKPARFKDGHI
jgi:hypothetical protein